MNMNLVLTMTVDTKHINPILVPARMAGMSLIPVPKPA